MRNASKGLLVAWILAISAGGCRSGSEQGMIDWQKGGMEAALKLAKEQSKPLFVYWGAVWCPPCNLLKATAFKDPTFVEATRGFVSVYLDGDTDEAQSWGEKLKASGYPTLLVLGPDGAEAARLQTGLSPAELAAALTRAREALAPIEDRVRRLLDAPAGASADVWRSVSEYAWDQRPAAEGDAVFRADVFEKLDTTAPPELKVEKSRFFLIAMGLRADPPSGKPASFGLVSRTGFAERYRQILSDPDLLATNLRAFAYQGNPVAAWLHAEDAAARAALLEAIEGGLTAFRASPKRTPLERLISWHPAVSAGHAKPEELTAEVKRALHTARDEQTHSFLLNAGAGLLFKAKLWDEAERLLMDHMKSSKWPYYVMSSLSELYLQKDDRPRALAWAEKAYRAAEGPATRLQWGTDYLSLLVKADPKSPERLVAETRKFLESSLSTSDAFHGRSLKRLEKLSQTLTGWAKEQQAQPLLQALAREFRDRCPPEGPCVAYFDAFGR
ncbi:MAG: thioredoxin family protein [Bdellovibrionales bacterium]|nr:thioredoxin family protein [Bdellovibrionales bacterium]